MKSLRVLYVISLGTTSENNGIKRQAEIWKDGLEKMGHTVSLHSPWSVENISNYDLIHVFGNGLWIIETIRSLSKFNIPICISPIIDSFKPHWQYWLASHMGFPPLRLYSINFALRAVKSLLNQVFVRSCHEYSYISDVYGFDRDKITLLRLPSRMAESAQDVTCIQKERFCFHISTYTQLRKNVWRLMEAAVKYNFKLLIAGSGGDPMENEKYLEFARSHSNIEIVGHVDDHELQNLYKRAKVFALPSIEEGVGFVALEAAVYGCNLVITNIGGPKEYYNGLAIEVNPYDVDSIGRGIVKAMDLPVNQELVSLVRTKYSLSANIIDLIAKYNQIINQNKHKS